MISDNIYFLKQIELFLNTLDTGFIDEHLSMDIEYSSPALSMAIINKNNVMQYLNEVIGIIKKYMWSNKILLNASIGYLPSMQMQPCIELIQMINNDRLRFIVLADSDGIFITEINIFKIPKTAEVIYYEQDIFFN